MEPVELQLEALGKGGEAIARLDGRVVLVDRGVPGDRVRVALREAEGRTLRGRVLELCEPSPERVAPACPIVERCGGCRWMAASAPLQARSKAQLLRDALERLGGLDLSAVEVRPLVSASPALGYRRRARLHVRKGRVGFLQEGSHELVEVQSCAVLEPTLDRALTRLPAALREAGLLAKASELDLVCDGDRWSFGIDVERLSGAVRSKLEAVVRTVGAEGAVVLERQPKARPQLLGRPTLGALRPDVFAQVNGASNEVLVAHALELLKPQPGEALLELFCGAGNFTLPLLAAGSSVVGIDSAGPALGLLRSRADAAGHGAALRFVEGDGLGRAKALAEEGRRFDALLLDPPRSGCSGLAPVLHRLGVQRVLYVSCDPATLARDLRELSDIGFRLRVVEPHDLFPQTPHVEAIALLERSPAASAPKGGG